MKIFQTQILDNRQIMELAELWNSEYPAQLRYETHEDFKMYLKNLSQAIHYLQIDEDQHVMSWAFKFLRGGDTWFAIILHRNVQHMGYGSLLLKALKAREQCLFGWVVDHHFYFRDDGEIYPSPLHFYLKNGFEVVPGQRLESEILSAAQIRWVREIPDQL